MLARYISNRFRARILALFCLIVLLPMITLSILLYNNIVRSAEARVGQEITNANSQWIAGYTARKEQLSTLSGSIVSNPVITRFFTEQKDTDAEMIKSVLYSFRPMIDWLLGSNESIVHIRFFTENEALPENRYVMHSSRFADESWFQELEQTSVAGRMLPAQPARTLLFDSMTTDELVVPYQMRIPGRPVTYVQLDISAQRLYQDISLVVEADSGRILFSTVGSQLVGEYFDLSILSPTDDSLHSLSLGDENYYFESCLDEAEGRYYITLVSANDISPELHLSRRSFLISCIVLVVLTLCMAYTLTNQVVNRVGRIGGLVAKVAHGEYLMSYTSRYNDEIDQLGRDVCEMGQQMDRLVNHGLRQEILTREAELRALQYQINPHFIFNTLESFQMLSELAGQRRLSDMMGLLGKLMRYNLGRTGMITLDQEIENVRDYIAVQNLNWNDRIELETDVDAELLSMLSLRLMLQPMVENAIVHGMPHSGSLRISITVKRIGQRISFRVSNNGKPMSAEEMQKLNAYLAEARTPFIPAGSKNIALQNIQRRLIVQYGADSLIAIEQSDAEGFVISFTIPSEEVQQR